MLIMYDKRTVLVAVDVVFLFKVFKNTIEFDFVGVSLHFLDLYDLLHSFSDIELLKVFSKRVWINLRIIKQILNYVLYQVWRWLLYLEVEEQVFEYHLCIMDHWFPVLEKYDFELFI